MDSRGSIDRNPTPWTLAGIASLSLGSSRFLAAPLVVFQSLSKAVVGPCSL